METSSGMEISGLNAEEQSDISLMVNWSGAQNPQGFILESFVFYDGNSNFNYSGNCIERKQHHRTYSIIIKINCVLSKIVNVIH